MAREEEKVRVWSYSQSHRLTGEGKLVTRANDFFEKAEVQGCSFDSVRAWAYGLLAFSRFAKNNYEFFESLTQKNLQDFMVHLRSEKKLSARSVNLRLSTVRHFYQFCFGKPIPHAAGVLYPPGHYRGGTKSPLRPGRPRRRESLQLKIKLEKKVMDPLKPEEVDQYLTHVRRYRDMGVVLTMLLCGLRSQEVIKLRVQDVDFHRNQLLVRGKGNRERMVPMPFRLMQLFERYLQLERPVTDDESFFLVLQGRRIGKSLTRPGIRRMFRYRSEKLENKKLRPHQFRHAFASDMALAGMPITSLQRLMGHADLKTTQIYINLFMDDIRTEYEKAVKRIEGRYASL